MYSLGNWYVLHMSHLWKHPTPNLAIEIDAVPALVVDPVLLVQDTVVHHQRHQAVHHLGFSLLRRTMLFDLSATGFLELEAEVVILNGDNNK